MGKKVVPVTDSAESPGNGRYAFWDCPGCGHGHVYNTNPANPGPCWTFNGDLEKPTFRASMLATWDHGENSVHNVCHFFITDGRIEFCGDCTHALANKTVELPDIE